MLKAFDLTSFRQYGNCVSLPWIVDEKYSYLFNLRPKNLQILMCEHCVNTHFIPDISDLSNNITD